MTSMKWLAAAALCAAVLLVGTVTPVAGQLAPERDGLIAAKEYYHPDLYISSMWSPASQLPVDMAVDVTQDLARLGVAPSNAHLDYRTGRWGTLIPTQPLIPGNGVGNRLTWDGLRAPKSDAELRVAVWDTLTGYLRQHEAFLKVSVDELSQPGRIVNHGDLIQVWAPRVIDGVPVRDSYLTAVISHGNLILFGVRNWNDVRVSTSPELSADEAGARAQQHLSGLTTNGFWRKPSLALMPVAQGDFLPEIPLGAGLGYRLVWSVAPDIVGEIGNWEALVDAKTGELLRFIDVNQYQTARTITGAVLPLSGDGIPPDGIEQPGWPMPFADAFNQSGLEVFADAGGNLPLCVDGPIATQLSGRYMNMNDNCGEILEFSNGDLDLGTSPGPDCQTAPGASEGNTRSSRSGFFEMNQIKAQARGYLTDNTWVRDQLTSNMNIQNLCNAFWDGATVNFFISGGGCGNTGEIAGIFDHEWGHGMDNFDVNPGIANPGEGIADIYASLRLQDSCMGRGFFVSGNCNGYGDPCLDCSGVRDIDWAERRSGEPHDIAWIDANCGAGPAPCGGGVHCEGSVYAESVWDLANRALPAAPFNLDRNTSFELATRMTYLGAGPVGRWYNCQNGQGTGDGCNADGGYLNYLAADDDNGSLADGTPHMSALFGAFDLHSIACDSPAVNNSGCETPSEAPVVSGTPRDKGASLNWAAVPGATKYAVYRTDGLNQCDYGKTKIGETSELSFIDGDGLLNGREYSYNVAAVGASDSCISPLSNCASVTPADGPNLTIDDSSDSLTILTGDSDDFLDNCEMATLSFDVANTGTGSVSNVRILDVRSPSHPIDITSDFPLLITQSLDSCGTANGAFDFTANGLGVDDTVEFEIDVTADELDGLVRSVTFTIPAAESDFESFASRTFSFEEGTEGWAVQSGTYNRTNKGGGGDGTSFYMASSANLEFQCDQVVSPVLSLSPSSTLSLWNNFDIEIEFQPGVWYDRANIGLQEANGERTPLNPDGGRLHNAGGDNGTCGTSMQDGFAGFMPTWAESTYSADAMMSEDFAGEKVRLAVYYGTDPLEHGYGFWFDEVTVTNVDVQVADAQPNDCGLVNPVLSVSGPCPGTQTVEVTGLTPNGQVGVAIGANLNGTMLPGGPCVGEMLDIGGVRRHRVVTANGDGVAIFTASPPQQACNGVVQAIDHETCLTSDVVPVQ